MPLRPVEPTCRLAIAKTLLVCICLFPDAGFAAKDPREEGRRGGWPTPVGAAALATASLAAPEPIHSVSVHRPPMAAPAPTIQMGRPTYRPALWGGHGYSAIRPAATGPRKTALIPNGIYDPETDRLYKNHALILNGDRIEAIVPVDRLHSNLRRISLDLTLLPGLTDLHVHLSVNDLSHRAKGGKLEPTLANYTRALEHARLLLEEGGYTTVRTLGTLHPSRFPVDIAVKQAIDQGRYPGPRIVPAGHPIALQGSHCDPTARFGPNARIAVDYRQGVIPGPDAMNAARAAVKAQIEYGAEWIKVCLTPGAMEQQKLNVSEEVLRAIVDLAAKHGVPVAAHAISPEGIEAAIRAGVRTIEHANRLNPELIELMIALDYRGHIVPTATVLQRVLDGRVDPRRQAALGDRLTDFVSSALGSTQLAIQHRVPIAFGSDSGMFPHGENAYEFIVLERLGMTPLAALRTATTEAAKVLGRTDIGNLKPGSRADIIGVPGNPLKDLSRLGDVQFVMIGGQVRKAEPTVVDMN